MKLAFGCDHGGFPAKNELIEFLIEKGYEVIDCGTFSDESCDYPDYAEKVCKLVTEKECEKGILICGTGIGMSIIANKVKGIRCGHCHDTFSARMTKMHNDANMIAFGERVIGESLMLDIVDAYLSASFVGGRHERRVNKIKAFEENN